MEPRGAAQAQVLAGDREHAGVDLADLLPPGWILGGQRPRERARSAADVHHAARAGRAQHDPNPAHVVELEVRRIGQIDVRGVHVALAQQPSGRAQRVALGDEIAGPGERSLAELRAQDTSTQAAMREDGEAG